MKIMLNLSMRCILSYSTFGGVLHAIGSIMTHTKKIIGGAGPASNNLLQADRPPDDMGSAP
jgi:hypothetical protein